MYHGLCTFSFFMDRNTYLKKIRRKHPDRLADPCKHLSVNRMAAGSRLQVQSWIFSSLTYFSNILCAVNLKVLGLLVYRLCLLPDTFNQSYTNAVHFVCKIRVFTITGMDKFFFSFFGNIH